MLKNSCDIFITTDNLNNKKIKDEDDDVSPTDDTMYGLNSTYIEKMIFLETFTNHFKEATELDLKNYLYF